MVQSVLLVLKSSLVLFVLVHVRHPPTTYMTFIESFKTTTVMHAKG